MTPIRKFNERALRSTLPSGQVITTPWPMGARASLAAECAQADKHREHVRYQLALLRGGDRQAA